MNDEKENTLVEIAKTVARSLDELGIPLELTKATTQTIARLLMGAGDVGVAKLEAYAAEIRARGDARASLTVATGEHVKGLLGTDAPVAKRAAAHYASKIIGEQINVEEIARLAIEDLRTARPENEQTEIPNDEWLNEFREEAGRKTTAEMREAFAKILSEEIQQPGTFSVKSLRTLSALDRTTAEIFHQLASAAIYTAGIPDARVLSLGGNANKNSLKEFDLSFDRLNALQEHGLIIADYNSYFPLNVVAECEFAIEYARRKYRLIDAHPQKTLRKGHGVSFTRVGRELYKAVHIREVPEYTKVLTPWLSDNMLRLEPLD